MGRGQPETSYPRAFTVGVDMAEVTYLQADGIIDRVDFGEIPPKVEYSLTTFGRTLGKALAPLCEWGTKYSSKVEAIVTRRKVQKYPRAA